MKLRNRRSAAPVRIGVYYLVWLVAAAMLCLQLIGMQPILEYASESKPYSYMFSRLSYGELLHNKGNSLRVICFGDSNFVPIYDGMSKLIDEEVRKRAGFEELAVTQRAFPAATMFDYYCMYFEAMNFAPDLIIYCINWRFFGTPYVDSQAFFHPELSAFAPLSEGADSSHESPLRSRGISLVKQIEYKLSLYALYPIGIKTWVLGNVGSFFGAEHQDAIHVRLLEKRDEATDSSPEQEEDDPENAWRWSATQKDMNDWFPMRVTESNLAMRDLRALADAASERGTKVLFFVWPLDREYLADIGILDKPALEHSIRIVMNATDKENIYFLDLSDLLEHPYFSDQYGHCKVPGQRKIAEALAPKVIEILKEGSAASHFTSTRSCKNSAKPLVSSLDNGYAEKYHFPEGVTR